MLAREAGDVDLQGDGADGGPEVEHAHGADAQPVGQVAGVGQGGGETHHPEDAGGVGRDEVGARDNHLPRVT